MIYTVVIDTSYAYCPRASSIGLAIRRACDEHDRKAKERQENGSLTPYTVAQLAKKGGCRIHVSARIERSGDSLAEVDPGVTDRPKRKRSKKVSRGILRR